MQIHPFKFSYNDAQRAFEQDKDRYLAVALLRYEGRMFRKNLKAEIFTEGISVSEYGHSIGLILSDEDELFFKSLEDYKLDEDPEFPFMKGYEMHPILKSDRLFLKLKTYQGKYKVKADITLDCNKPEKAPLARGDLVEVEVEIKLYLNLQEKKAGFIFDLLRLKTEKAPPIKKRKS